MLEYLLDFQVVLDVRGLMEGRQCRGFRGNAQAQ
jgi:hypothetical protein